jgi:hypothetical protein
MECRDCRHDEHRPGQCKKCNCGECGTPHGYGDPYKEGLRKAEILDDILEGE